MTAGAIATLAAGFALQALLLQSAWHDLNRRCARPSARALLVALNLAGAAAIAALALVGQAALLVLAGLLIGPADVWPRGLVTLSGGPDRRCLLLGMLRETLTLIQGPGMAEDAVTRARGIVLGMETVRTARTAPVIDAAGHLLDVRFGGEVEDLEKVRAAYEQLQRAIKELWPEAVVQPLTP